MLIIPPRLLLDIPHREEQRRIGMFTGSSEAGVMGEDEREQTKGEVRSNR